MAPNQILLINTPSSRTSSTAIATNTNTNNNTTNNTTKKIMLSRKSSKSNFPTSTAASTLLSDFDDTNVAYLADDIINDDHNIIITDVHPTSPNLFSSPEHKYSNGHGRVMVMEEEEEDGGSGSKIGIIAPLSPLYLDDEALRRSSSYLNMGTSPGIIMDGDDGQDGRRDGTAAGSGAVRTHSKEEDSSDDGGNFDEFSLDSHPNNGCHNTTATPTAAVGENDGDDDSCKMSTASDIIEGSKKNKNKRGKEEKRGLLKEVAAGEDSDIEDSNSEFSVTWPSSSKGPQHHASSSSESNNEKKEVVVVSSCSNEQFTLPESIINNNGNSNNNSNVNNSIPWWQFNRRATIQAGHAQSFHAGRSMQINQKKFMLNEDDAERKKLCKSENDFQSVSLSDVAGGGAGGDFLVADDGNGDNGALDDANNNNNDNNLQWWQFGRGNMNNNQGGEGESIATKNTKNCEQPPAGLLFPSFRMNTATPKNNNHQNNSKQQQQEQQQEQQQWGDVSELSADDFSRSRPKQRTLPSNSSAVSSAAQNNNNNNNHNSNEENNRRIFPRRSSAQHVLNRRGSSGGAGLRGSSESLSRRNSMRSSAHSSMRSSLNSAHSGLEGFMEEDVPHVDPNSAEDVDAIVENMRRKSVVISPIEMALLNDMANTKGDRLMKRWESVKKVGATLRTSKSEDSDDIMDDNDETTSPRNEDDGSPQSQHAPKFTLEDNNDKNDDSNDATSVWSCLEDESDKPCSRWKSRDEEKGDDQCTNPQIQHTYPEESPKSTSQTLTSTDRSNTPSQESEQYDNFQPVEWGSAQLCKIKDGVRLAKVHMIDDVSSIASSEHSGRLAFTKKKSVVASRRKSLAASVGSVGRRSIGFGLGWNRSGINLKDPSVASARDFYDDEDEEDVNLEEEIFAAKDAKCEAIVKDACELMNKVNKSVVAMGNEAPFRPVDEIFPTFKKIHKNLLLQMDGLDANVRSHRTSNKSTSSKKNSKKKNIRYSALQQSMISLRTNASGTSKSQSKDSQAAVDAILKQVALSMQSTNLKSSFTSESSSSLPTLQSLADKSQAIATKHYTAYLPNFMWYQFIAADPSSTIKPTSLCSGTGISGGHQYLDPNMLNVFSMFGSYFVGAFGTFQEDDEGNAKDRRAAVWLESIDEEGSMMSESTSESDLTLEISESELLSDSDSIADPPVDAQIQIEMLEKVIADLRRASVKTAETRGYPLV